MRHSSGVGESIYRYVNFKKSKIVLTDSTRRKMAKTGYSPDINRSGKPEGGKEDGADVGLGSGRQERIISPSK